MKLNLCLKVIVGSLVISCSGGADLDTNSVVNENPVEENRDTEDQMGTSDPDSNPETPPSSFRTIPVPVDLGDDMTWEFQEFSDDFEYSAPAADKGDEFFENWDDFYHNPWTGPALTEWSRTSSFVGDGRLQMSATRVAGSNKINQGCITGKTRVLYPVYIEARAKVMNSTLASDVWLLSPDDTQEIDILEAYGASFSESANSDHTWFAERIHLSHHVFIREPFADYQPTDAGSWYTNGNTTWREEFHRYGVYWRDPWHLEYYIDGQLVRTVSGRDMIDPLFHTNATDPGNTSVDTRTGLSKEMDIIINTEDQLWRSSPDSGRQSDTYTPTDVELANQSDHTFEVDWIRIFKPVAQ